MQLNGLGKEGFRAGHIASFAETDIHQIAIFINTPVEVAPHSFYSDKSFVHQPNLTDSSFPLCSDLVDKMGQKAFLPIPYGFMGELNAYSPNFGFLRTLGDRKKLTK